jgi:hypothetical protein
VKAQSSYKNGEMENNSFGGTDSKRSFYVCQFFNVGEKFRVYSQKRSVHSKALSTHSQKGSVHSKRVGLSFKTNVFLCHKF